MLVSDDEDDKSGQNGVNLGFSSAKVSRLIPHIYRSKEMIEFV
jgi:hypothetical protein